MANRSNSVKTLVIALVSAFVLVALILVLFFVLTGSDDDPGIILPAQTQPGTQTAPGEMDDSLFLQVTAENVTDVVQTLARPSSYHQALTLTTAWQDGSVERTAELWVSGGICRADLTDGETVKSFLSDGKMVYMWYQDDELVTSFAIDEAVTLDDLMGIPTYESLLAADPALIRDAAFVSLDDMNGRSCIYAQVTDESGYTDSYWIDVSTGLLCRADSFEEQTLIYKLQESAIEILLASDEAFVVAFALPDGTAPFASEE